MASSRVEFLIKGLGSFVAVDVSNFAYRLNRMAFEISSNKLKSLGGTFSTGIKLSKKSKRNNLVFIGKTDIKSIGKFNAKTDYEAVIRENGSEVGRGTFRLEGTTDEDYEGIFFDKDSDWIEKLDKLKLNKLGYVDNKPTWLVDFNGAITFDEVNDLSNRETDFIVPTVIWNNTPILDYLDLTDNEIWGEFDNNDELINSGVNLPSEFKVVNGFPSVLRQGLKFTHFPPALYYRNVIERVLKEVGLAVDCSLFYEDWFNALYMSYEGSDYLYNWKNIGSVYSFTPSVFQSVNLSMDKIETTDVESTIELNKLELPFLGGGAPTQFWISDEQFLFKFGNIIKHDGFGPTVIDKVTLTNSFDREGAYLVPVDGSYKIKVASQYENRHNSFTQHGGGGGGGGGNVYWLGSSLINAFGSWDANSDSSVPNFADRRYSWDDNVLVVMRKDANGSTNPDTLRILYEWMNGQNKDLTTEKSDIIAYFSPKRWALNDGGIPVPIEEIMGSPYSEFEKTVKIGFGGGVTEFVSHELVNNSTPKHSRSTAEIEIEIDLNEGDLVEIFWVALGNIFGEVNRAPQVPLVFDYAVPLVDMEQNFGAAIVDQTPDPAFDKSYYSIDYLCGEFDLDLAANLPNISGKDFIGSFITQYNLHYKVNDRTVSFYPVKNYYTKESYDITSRVDISKGWKALPIQTPKNWIVGYNNDPQDRLLLLSSKKRVCVGDVEIFTDYANVSFESENTNSENTISDVSIFSATKYVRSPIAVNPFGFGLDSFPFSFPLSISPLDPSFFLVKGLILGVIAANGEFNLDFPSHQSEESFKIKRFGDWSLTFGYSPRLNYHLGTANQYFSEFDENYGTLIDMPRSDIDYFNLRKHWFRPTVSQFDGENSTLTGINYPTLRYDTEEGLYLKFFENLLEFYNLSETLELRMSVTTKDWNELDGSKRVRFLDQLYRLMSIKDYDVDKRNLAIIKLLKEV